MKIIRYPQAESRSELLKRPVVDNTSLQEKVREILAAVKADGDAAVKNFTAALDGVRLDTCIVSEVEIELAINLVPDNLKLAIQQAAANIRKFHLAQVETARVIETMPGIQCWRKNVAIEKVGLYIPGGTAPLFSTVLMLGIPASIAGCREIVLCSPPDGQGMLHPAILFAARLVGITAIYKAGGAQAIGAMAYGTETIPRVYKIFGPGNQYVTRAKQLVQLDGTTIDMPAGPSEVCILADATGNGCFIAADLLSQAEHGPDSQVLLVTTDELLVKKVEEELEQQLKKLPRKDLAAKALANSSAIVVSDMEEGIALVNEYAAEHLIIACSDADNIAGKIVNAGSVFIGNYSPESAGDYASGTNHTLPTNGYAVAHSGVSVDSFVRKITYQKLSEQGLKNIAGTVMLMAEAEGMEAHANAVRVRLNDIVQEAT